MLNFSILISVLSTNHILDFDNLLSTLKSEIYM